ncbi:hexitol phosphatase HxpB [Salmonella enterica subsp. diarizonae]|nr:hexitol phosphatase HxpB [Salmonella enterica subsp. diarizonae serovar 61:k:1,5,(7)]EIS8708384.1 hexitol phosphatase HxpB [Salmonella enterica subsp. diarizonae]
MSKIIIFDMDGVLIDSEPVWQQVECEFYLRHYNISLGPKDFDLFTGMPVGIFLRKLHENHGLPSNNLPQIQDTIVAQVAEKIRQKPKPIAGIFELLNYLQRRGSLMAVASSSPQYQIDNVLNTLNIRHYFSAVVSADGLSYGKPHPEIFLTAAAMLKAEPETCLVIEDSLNGVIAARAAGMRVIALPAEHQQNDPRFTIADTVILNHCQVLEWLTA